ncbi:MAG: hypothetical protein D3910_02370 [Candidatus Electrothrix sp. ATG2]|nr:hypothetical protein [Candidatus Electrothrix sp. ATG2]
MTEENKKQNQPEVENAGRRTIVKAIVGGVTAVAAFHSMPSQWSTPIIEQVLLPAHAQTSGGVTATYQYMASNTHSEEESVKVVISNFFSAGKGQASGSRAVVTFQNEDNTVRWEGTINYIPGVGSMSIIDGEPCPRHPRNSPREVEITYFDESIVSVSIPRRKASKGPIVIDVPRDNSPSVFLPTNSCSS